MCLYRLEFEQKMYQIWLLKVKIKKYKVTLFLECYIPEAQKFWD